MTPSATPENYTTLTDVTWGQLTSARAARHWAAVNDNLTEFSLNELKPAGIG